MVASTYVSNSNEASSCINAIEAANNFGKISGFKIFNGHSSILKLEEPFVMFKEWRGHGFLQTDESVNIKYLAFHDHSQSGEH